ncbi:MAG TPA: hypothetical protein VGI81_25960 [Tepidisphaeraceae bacterium]|jgi:membrane associated rhomboid family serine protease
MDVLKSPEMLEADDSLPVEAKPGTWKVLLLLILAAGTFSYLGAYAATDALAKVDVIRPISHEHDPRPVWAAIIFGAIMTLFLAAAVLMRCASGRQFKEIDRMNE